MKREPGDSTGGAEATSAAAPGKGSYVCEVEVEADAAELSPAARDAREKIRTGRYSIDLSELADALVGSLGPGEG